MHSNKRISREELAECTVSEYSWVGSQIDFVDEIDIYQLNHVSIGRFGGNSAEGQYKNEDGCKVWLDKKGNWEFAIVLDAHHSAESAELVMEQMETKKFEIQNLLNSPSPSSIKEIEYFILNMFMEEKFLTACRKVKGETACLLVLRKDTYLWWFSIGDCILYLFHPELAELGQFQVNQRQFYEWVGQVNTFEQAVPCYSSGVRELRKGLNIIFITTDGLIECPNEPFASPKAIYHEMRHLENNKGVKKLLTTIQENNVRDSTTIISWEVNIYSDVTRPSNE